MNDLPKKPFNKEPPSSPEYLIPVKNINAYMFSEPDVGYINGKIEDCEDTIVSLDLVRYRQPKRKELLPKHTENPDPPLFDVSLHSSADTSSVQNLHHTSKPAPKFSRMDTPVPQQHPSEKVTDSSGLSDKIYNFTRFPFTYPDPSEVETSTDLSTLKNESRPTPAREASVYFSDSFKTVSHQDTKKTEVPSLDDIHITIDEALEQLVCSDPFLSEKDLLILLQQEYHGSFKLSRRSLKKQLVKNGLDNGYKRFRAYIAG